MAQDVRGGGVVEAGRLGDRGDDAAGGAGGQASSLGVEEQDLDPLEEAVNSLSARTGTLFVISAGNDGRPGTVSSAGSADAALTVGAVDRSDRIADFSSQGPRQGDHAIKPDITAPGVNIVAAAAGGAYRTLSGTSMAARHVAGAAAILAQKHPDWTGRQSVSRTWRG
ncbi:S8 family serine peptidase [Nonomuraea sp. H19]|uniref:S8 family serine peptidase n=1 Tax=Nonomuraea sp. H19 TaxID=3452206 RepID=UPI003F889566